LAGAAGKSEKKKEKINPAKRLTRAARGKHANVASDKKRTKTCNMSRSRESTRQQAKGKGKKTLRPGQKRGSKNDEQPFHSSKKLRNGRHAERRGKGLFPHGRKLLSCTPKGAGVKENWGGWKKTKPFITYFGQEEGQGGRVLKYIAS